MNKELTTQTIGGLARHAGGLAAGALLANGYIDESMTQQVIGIVSGLLMVGWSMWQKRMAIQKAEQKGARFDKAA